MDYRNSPPLVLLRESVQRIHDQLRRNLDENALDHARFMLTLYQEAVSRYVGFIPNVETISQLLRQAVVLIEEELASRYPGESELTVLPVLESSEEKGRPRFVIQRQHLEELFDLGCTVAYVANLLGVSKRTIERRMSEFGISVARTYTHLSDEELDQTVREIVERFPNIGYRRLTGFLVSKGLKVSREKIRASLKRVHPEGILLRSLELNIVKRRQYNVRGPLALWHVDGNHKLIRWRMVIHGGIDGFSRRIMFIKCSDNNRAETVFQSFEQAVFLYGLPLRVRSDKGRENCDVAWYMLNHPQRGPEMASFITGRSVHNQRIERLWRDVYTVCTYIYHQLFSKMENQGLLDADDEMRLFCLHYVFIPRINRDLHDFSEAFNNTPMRTERNKTPVQLWNMGLLEGRGPPIQEEIEEIDYYGVDWEGPFPEIDDGHGHRSNAVDVPATDCPIAPMVWQQLITNIDPLRNSQHCGVDIYMDVLEFINEHLNN